MSKLKLANRLMGINSQKEALFELEQFEKRITRKAFNFIFSIYKKRKSIRMKRLKLEWLGDNGVLSEIQNKYIRQNV